jgi:hypothetical protein
VRRREANPPAIKNPTAAIDGSGTVVVTVTSQAAQGKRAG